MDFATKLKL